MRAKVLMDYTNGTAFSLTNNLLQSIHTEPPTLLPPTTAAVDNRIGIHLRRRVPERLEREKESRCCVGDDGHRRFRKDILQEPDDEISFAQYALEQY